MTKIVVTIGQERKVVERKRGAGKKAKVGER